MPSSDTALSSVIHRVVGSLLLLTSRDMASITKSRCDEMGQEPIEKWISCGVRYMKVYLLC